VASPEAQLIENKWAKHSSVGWSIDSEEVQEVLVNGKFPYSYFLKSDYVKGKLSDVSNY